MGSSLKVLQPKIAINFKRKLAESQGFPATAGVLQIRGGNLQVKSSKIEVPEQRDAIALRSASNRATDG